MEVINLLLRLSSEWKVEEGLDEGLLVIIWEGREGIVEGNPPSIANLIKCWSLSSF